MEIENDSAGVKLTTPLKKMADLKAEMVALKSQLSLLNQSYASAQQQALELMESGEIQNLKFETEVNGAFTAYATNVLNVKIEDDGNFREWADMTDPEGLGADGFRMWSNQKIKACIRERLNNENASLPDGVSVKEIREVRLRKD